MIFHIIDVEPEIMARVGFCISRFFLVLSSTMVLFESQQDIVLSTKQSQQSGNALSYLFDEVDERLLVISTCSVDRIFDFVDILLNFKDRRVE